MLYMEKIYSNKKPTQDVSMSSLEYISGGSDYGEMMVS